MEEATVYRDRSHWPLWATCLLWGGLAGSVLLLHLVDDEASEAFKTAMTAVLLGFGLLMHFVMGGLTVLVQETRLLIHLGMVPLVRKRVRYEEIISLRSTTYRPLRDFGGWGIRSHGVKQAWTSSGSKAVVLELAGGTELYVGSAEPEFLEEMIRRAMA